MEENEQKEAGFGLFKKTRLALHLRHKLHTDVFVS